MILYAVVRPPSVIFIHKAFYKAQFLLVHLIENLHLFVMEVGVSLLILFFRLLLFASDRRSSSTPLRGVWNGMKSLGSAWGWVASLILKISSLVEPTQRIFGAPCSFFFLALSNPPSTFTFQTAPRKTTLFAGPPSNEQFLAPLLLTKYRYQPLQLEPLQLEGLEIWRFNGPQR